MNDKLSELFKNKICNHVLYSYNGIENYIKQGISYIKME